MKNITIRIFLATSIVLLFSSGCRENFHTPADPGFITYQHSPGSSSSITITSPVKSSFWKPGEMMKIKWITSGSVEKVDIQLYRKSTFIISVTNNLENRGSFKWYIPDDIDHSLHYHIKIINHYNPNEYKLSDRFAIKD